MSLFHYTDPSPDVRKHYEDITLLSLIQTMGKIGAMQTFGKLQDLNPMSLKDRVNDLTTNTRLVGGVILRKSGNDFLLESADRIITVTPTFLAGVAADWSSQLLKAITEFK